MEELKKNWKRSSGELEKAQINLLYNEYGQTLYNAIWQPLEEALEGVNTVFYSPSGQLHRISFNAIPKDGKRLSDIYDLNLVSTTREVTYRNRIAQKPQSVVIYGGLEYNVNETIMRQEALVYKLPETETQIVSVSQQRRRNRTASRALSRAASRGGIWGYLFYTSEESRVIQRILENNKVNVVSLSGAKGNKESFFNLDGKKMSVIHLATHGFFEPDIKVNYEKREMLERIGGGLSVIENPLLRSGLILSGGNHAWIGRPVEGVENGILLADDVAKMNLVGTELVVMSACETALGVVDNSEGVFGLQRAFKLAGAQTLIMSLWKVDDLATSLLMGAFYENWLSGKTKQDAFKEAQRKMRADARYASPFYWAAFVLMD